MFIDDIKTERYPRVLDEMQNVFQRERNVTHERGLFYGRKQRENETFEKFHAELSALAGRCDFANAAENVRDIFIMNISTVHYIYLAHCLIKTN